MVAWLYLTASVLAEQIIPPAQVAAKIDGFLESHWSTNEIEPAGVADDATFLRRVTLDLVGRIPTTRELDRFLSNKQDDRRQRQIEQLVESPEFPLYFGNVLDQMIQTRYADHADFVDYLRQSVRDHKQWDAIFRELMLGPWDTEESKPANLFLDKRAKTLDVLVADVTRVFFGVDISCAKCHDHPLVDDWKQEHFYGMASFFNRTTGGKGKVGEKNEGEVTFQGADGEQTAKMMFLSGRVIEEPSAAQTESTEQEPAAFSRREQLVNIALEDKVFFGRSIVNRIWQNMLGRGLVEPVDQMHSGNQAAIPGLLEWLADDFASSGYDLRRLVTAIVNTRAYQFRSQWEHDSPIPEPALFAVMPLRPLSRQQLAFSLLISTGNAKLTEPNKIESRVERYVGVPGIQRIEQFLTIEQQAAELAGSLDPRTKQFHSSTTEALFMSNNAAAQRLVAARGDNLAARLDKIKDTRKLVATAVRSVLSRPAREEETASLTNWFETQTTDRTSTSEQLIWVLMTSAEFRFNY